MKYFLKSAAFKVILGIILIVFGVILYTVSTPDNNIFLNALTSATTPFQKALWYVSDQAFGFAYQFEEKEKLEKENTELRSEVNRLREITADYGSVKLENARFEKYYELKESNKSLKFVSASVVGRDPTEFFGDFFINKGIDDGVSLNDAVITDNGVVGKVCGISASSSMVKSILSPECKMGVINSRTGDSGVISGAISQCEQGLTRIVFIPAQSDMRSEDIVVTSGVSGMYPKNLKLGKIKSIEYDNYESAYYAVLEPFEKVKEIKEVFVVSDFDGKGLIDIKLGNKS